MEIFARLRWLLNCDDVQVDRQDMDGWTALCSASSNFQYHAAQLLIDHGANIENQNSYGRTALLWASQTKSIDVARLLIDRGANTEHQDYDGRRLLLHASCNYRFGMISLLLDHMCQHILQDRFWLVYHRHHSPINTCRRFY
jgi:ankyrin repeat protein